MAPCYMLLSLKLWSTDSKEKPLGITKGTTNYYRAQ